MKKIIIPIYILFSILGNVAHADTSTDKIVTIPAPSFKPNPVTVPTQVTSSVAPQVTLELTNKSTNAVSPEIIQPPAFNQNSSESSSASTLGSVQGNDSVKNLAVKPAVLEPQSIEERLPSSQQSTDVIPAPTTSIAPAQVQPYLLDNSGPGIIWKFFFIFLILSIIVIAENRIRLKKKLNM